MKEFVVENVCYTHGKNAGKPVTLNAVEVSNARQLSRQLMNGLENGGHKLRMNDLGYEIQITTLTAIIKRITTQKFATIPFPNYMPVVVGEGAWSTSLLKYVTGSSGDAFEKGILDTGANSTVLAKANTAVQGINIPIKNWAEEYNFSIFDLEFASKSGNWDIVESLERARKTTWDLGLQRTSFLGMSSNANIRGMLNQSNVNSNTSVITQYISSMNTTQYSAFTQTVVDAYRQNCNFTAYPTHFTIPELDYNGLVSPVSADFPVIDKLSYLQKAFASVCQNPNFKILPCFYADEINNTGVADLSKNRYTLYRYDQDSFSMNIPVNYNSTQQNTINGFNWQNVGYGQFTGVVSFRPAELLYFDFA